MLRRCLLVPFVLLALVAGACSSSSSSEDASPLQRVADALDASATPTYRVTQFSAQEFTIPAAGLDTSTDYDPSRPTVIGEFTPGGQHFLIDIGAATGLADTVGSIEIEGWLTDDLMVMDTTQMQKLLDLNPAADLGPMKPGVGSVDLARVRAGGPELVALITGGSAAADLADLAESLPDVLDDVEEAEPGLFTGKAKWADVQEALGGDIDAVAAGAASGMALNLQIDAKALGQVYADFYRGLDSDVSVRVVDGTVSSIELSADLSGIFDEIFDNADLFGGVDAADLESGRDQLAGAVLKLRTRMDFQLDDSLTLPPIPDGVEDRTDAWVAFYDDQLG